MWGHARAPQMGQGSQVAMAWYRFLYLIVSHLERSSVGEMFCPSNKHFPEDDVVRLIRAEGGS